MPRLRTLTLLLFLLSGSAFAQPQPPIVPLEPQVEAPEEVIGTLILVDESASQVLNLLETITGKIILRRQDIQVKINFNSNGPLTKGEAILALESLLTLNGVMLTEIAAPICASISVEAPPPPAFSGTGGGVSRSTSASAWRGSAGAGEIVSKASAT